MAYYEPNVTECLLKFDNLSKELARAGGLIGLFKGNFKLKDYVRAVVRSTKGVKYGMA